jgi:hypothetical protein
MGRKWVASVAVSLGVAALSSGCGLFEDKPFGGESEIRYGPEAKPAKVDCERSHALDDLDGYENVWSCEITLEDGSGRIQNCWARKKSTESTFFSLDKTCEEWAVELSSSV